MPIPVIPIVAGAAIRWVGTRVAAWGAKRAAQGATSWLGRQIGGRAASLVGGMGRIAGTGIAGIGGFLLSNPNLASGKYVDSFTHQIRVRIAGGPQADLRRVYYLALSTLFGRYARGGVERVTGSSSRLTCQIDVTGKVVQVALEYKTSLLGDIKRAVTGERNAFDVIYDGPDQLTVGGSFPSQFIAVKRAAQQPAPLVIGGALVATGEAPTPPVFADVTPGAVTPFVRWALRHADTFGVVDPLLLPTLAYSPGFGTPSQALREAQVGEFFYLRKAAARVGQLIAGDTDAANTAYTIMQRNRQTYPTLPDDGRIITTGETQNVNVQHPKPALDGVFFSTFVDLFVQILHEPGSMPPLPAPTGDVDPNVATGGVYLWAPGAAGPTEGGTRRLRTLVPPGSYVPSRTNDGGIRVPSLRNNRG